MQLDRIEDIIEDIRLGKMVILMDDEDRENEGDILIAAEKITAEHINFMAKEGRGLICLTITEARARSLNLAPMVKHNTEQFGTNFTVSIEAAEGVSTGISAADRAMTIAAAVAVNAKAADLVSPGHVFPIIAREGGVLVRAGHTEAGCDLARLAGLEPACAIVEVLNPDGTMARRPQLEEFAKQHGIKLGTIADLIKYRLETESVVTRVREQQLETEFGIFDLVTYQDSIDGCYHYAMTQSGMDICKAEPTLVRVHTLNTWVDLFHVKSSNWSMTSALKKIADEGGVFVFISKVLPQGNIDIFAPEIVNKPVAPTRSQEVGIGSRILQDLGVGKIKLLSSSVKHYHSLSGFGLEVIEYIKQ
ncbi:3,4-dihydroxy-2-butanone-4-phosphate synthase [Vibrio sp. HA2012]|uniref:3,4-dihydroxy-2-butanone-4-phosphate synthase n=1 Tax=Vibrio sp. HA2012 TaxID=1971595 RepID=UPI000C2C809E|nr:3,4-dihydroxy-2-butanone-4-phosphate synthase [Vibrio sp. HA2012]PJC87198.1 3,4-dihydroxy-2-butanone-4-phosphate synthase [Vibrio sp. HA2012]